MLGRIDDRSPSEKPREPLRNSTIHQLKLPVVPEKANPDSNHHVESRWRRRTIKIIPVAPSQTLATSAIPADGTSRAWIQDQKYVNPRLKHNFVHDKPSRHDVE